MVLREDQETSLSGARLRRVRWSVSYTLHILDRLCRVTNESFGRIFNESQAAESVASTNMKHPFKSLLAGPLTVNYNRWSIDSPRLALSLMGKARLF